MKKLLIGLMLLFSTTVFADRIDDVKKYPPQDYCTYIGGLYHYGVYRHNDGAKLEFQTWNKEEEPEGNEYLYIRDLDKMTDNEKEFILEHITKGWEYADTLKGAPVDPNQAAYLYYYECMKEKAKEYGEKHIKKMNFIQTGSVPPMTEQQASELIIGKSGHMHNTDFPKANMCLFQERAADFVIHHKELGWSEQAFWKLNPLPEGWSTEIKEVTIKIVQDAYKWEGTPEAYVEKVKTDCLK